ncbi:MAG: hypothetical protein IKA64_00990 [Clostridia bacterium]|nr:hypothetical protein [Clostridia bacterium]
MGFGSLFLGYFLLLNITYYGFTDIIAALIMLTALLRLAPLYRPFKLGVYAASVFAVFGAFELVARSMELFGLGFIDGVWLSYVAVIRYVIISVLTALILLGIKEAASEVGATRLRTRAHRMLYCTFFLYLLSIAAEAPTLGALLPDKALAVLILVTLIGTLVVIGFNLSVIWGANAEICMPEDDKPMSEDKKSRFGFVNEYKRRQREKDEEYAKYRAERLKKKRQKRDKKK